jgi:predicted nucleotidyltransferase
MVALPSGVQGLADALGRLDGVVAVSLGGSRAQGTHHEGSDWDLGLYSRGTIDAHAVRALGHDGYVSEPGEWAPFMYGGAWLRVDGLKVDILYRNLETVERYTAMAADGSFEIARTPGYLVGMASYVLAGEVATGVVLHGSLDRPAFPERLRERAPQRWRWEAEFALLHAQMAADRGDEAVCAGSLAQALVAEAYGRLCARAEWALNDKGVVSRAGLGSTAAEAMEAVGTDAARAVEIVRNLSASA